MNITRSFFVFSIIACMCATTTAQDDAAESTEQQELRALFVGTWDLDYEKSKSVTPEKDLAEMNEESGAIQLIFDEEGKIKMVRDGRDREMEYKIELVKDSDPAEYTVVFSSGGREMKGTASFAADGEMKFAPESDPAVILVRQAKIYSLEEAKKLLEGKWETDVNATEKINDESDLPGGKVPNIEMTLNADGSLSASQNGMESPEGGKWKLEATETEGEFNLNTNVDNDDRVFAIKIAGADTIHMTPDESFTVVFQRNSK